MRKRKQYKILENITITQIADQGIGIGRIEGKVIMAENTIPGDVIDLQITKGKSDYAIGYAAKFHEYSKLRVIPFCEHFGVCGGCTWQNVSYETQLEFKTQLVQDAFRRIGKIESLEILPVLSAPFDKYYRNKLEFTFTNSGYVAGRFSRDEIIEKKPALGFHVRKEFAHVFDIKHCYLQPYPSNEIRLALKAYATVHQLSFYDLRNQSGYLRNVIVKNTLTNGLMVILVVAENKPDLLIPLLQHLSSTFPEITSLYYCINQKNNDSTYDQEMILFAGDKFITEQIDNIKYNLGPKSFFQTNITQAVNLYHIALEYADLKKEDIVYDFYTGLGSIALLAAVHCKKVIGVESVEAAVEDAKMNAEANNINNCTFIYGDMAKVFDNDFINTYGKANVVITDPPRVGMHKDVCLKLLELEPEKIVYVSCNPVTQARDIQILSDKYEVIKLQPVDMFPQTYHVENVALLHLKES
ncbi:MAG: 23S rRNA (uracil(1939)-C(5))-methyltransferase RlmD [Chitinophagales bacterium]|jgi:23S rRNA (uracil1939-C5)-methyltransferase|nr:23S rRNA (uracil(1939)-C(5))-methyltransferase RlmD [Bacteroidota bacterium]MBP8915118.1 23S rRNA (uracil(1939)-C(5))-methyltransferase RlmD [Chitinophagales bacterium]MBP9219789.1 23S rRNA (uracil(1939)-C(5))-methyltransferase RlmD [Chitinophagales bacterium]MBP9795132.1 23S rRNA (uracil(1939)-C(5))-methyltransferase RlmD [Chitinophagales bacterium]